MFGISTGIISKVMIAFEKEKKMSPAKSRICQIKTIEIYIKLLERTIEIQHLKLLLSLMNTLRTICPQKLSITDCTKTF